MTETRVRCSPAEEDELHPGRRCCTLSFFLPSGAYTTMAGLQLLEYAAN